MITYGATTSSARAYAEEGRLDEWIHLYLNNEGRNPAFSEGIKLFERYFIAPARFPIKLFKRCTGPEPGMKYAVDQEGFERRVAGLEEAAKRDPDMPPLIVQYWDGEFELNDGNHRYQAYKNLGIEEAWVIMWLTKRCDYEDFMKKYGKYVEGCRVIHK